ncbi:MAG: alpha/beta hydrolase [Spirulina sp. DLM2.Bin59]|nr:MAG: alpha/beta hydrolase [Spirulina sp. DLM2.Bin59]
MLTSVTTGLCLGIGIYALLCLLLWRWQNRLTFFPSRRIRYFPDQYQMPYETVWLDLPDTAEDSDADANRLHGWWIPAPGATQVVYLLHGNGFNMGANLAQAQVFHRLGYHVFLIDYRGYGQSVGPFPTETQVYQDAQVGLDYLTTERGYGLDQVIVFGHSMGGAIAIELAAQNPDIAALIIQGSFTNLRDMADHDGVYKLLPIDLILRQSFDSLSKVPSLPMPLFFIHGEADRRVPAWMSDRLYQVAQSPYKDLYFLPDGDHNHVPEIGGESYQCRVGAFLTHVAQASVATNPG